MELHEFITGTLVQITQGIEDANNQLNSNESIVNPRNVVVNHTEHAGCYAYMKEGDELKDRVVEKIEFNIAITVTEGTQTKSGIGVALGVIAAGSTGKSDAQNTAQSRIKFSLPIVFPNGKLDK